MKVLGIETSCDETAAAVVDGDGAILSNLVFSQLDDHRAFGGVVPEIAARAHLHHLPGLIARALEEARIRPHELDGVAATCGPGLIGGVMVGMMAGKAMAAAHGLPFIGVNHLEAHALTPRLTDRVSFPYLLLLVSGGHTQLLAAEEVGRYRLLGTTLDDALGECFDKSAKLMGLPWPGGPHMEKMARQCDDPARAAARFALPRPLAGRAGCDFSFSGLKTAMRTHIEALPPGPLRAADVADLACAFEEAVCAIMAERCGRALDLFCSAYPGPPVFVASGGVAANQALRGALKGLTEGRGGAFIAPPGALCSDNAAMVAWAGVERLLRGMTDPLDMAARPRWPLDPDYETKAKR